jgi:aryl-alcohol dehydrogenase-like predicted oxidoreductase
MHYRRLGYSNLRVSEICLGTMMFGGLTISSDAANILASAKEHGINFLDTADTYNHGESERTLGELLAGQRDDWVLASKLGIDLDRNSPGAATSWINRSRYSRRWLIQETDAILQRLGTDYLDILYLHRDYHDENLEEMVLSVGDLIRQGKIRGLGLSNFRGWRIAEVVRLCKEAGVPPPVACEPHYNLLNREAEVEILPACGHYGVGVVPYSPLARGVLTGKYEPGVAPSADSRAGRGDKRILEMAFHESSLTIAAEVKARALSQGVQPSHFALAWILANPVVSSVIVGPRTLSHLEDAYGALDVAISSEDEEFVDALVVPGHASVAGLNDPSYPFYGRHQTSR